MTVSVEECLDQKAYTQKYEQIITGEKGGSTPFQLYCCDGIQSVKIKPISTVEHRGTSENSTTEVSLEQPNTSGHEQALSQEISDFEKLKKVKLNSLVETECHGSPVVYIDPDTNESSVIGVHVGDTDQIKGRDVEITWHGILKMLQGLVYTNIAMDIGLSGFHLKGGQGGSFAPKKIDNFKTEYGILGLGARGKNVKSSTKCYTSMVLEFTKLEWCRGHTPQNFVFLLPPKLSF